MSLGCHVFFLYFRNSEKNVASQKARRLFNSYNLCLCSRPAHVGVSWLWAQVQVLQNKRSQIVMLRFKTLSVSDLLWQIQGGGGIDTASCKYLVNNTVDDNLQMNIA